MRPKLREFGFAVAHELYQSSVASLAGGNERAMRQIPNRCILAAGRKIR